MKKNSILALVLTVAMIFAVNVPVMAAEVTTTPAGGTLFLPPAGQMSSVELGLDVDGTPAEGVTSNITNNAAGVFKSGNSLILDGDLTKAGSVTVNATAGGNTASSTMQVSPYILYEDFEDGTVGANVSTTKIEKLSASAEDKSMFASSSTALIAGDSSNKYGLGNSNVSTVVIPLDALSENGYNGKVTITAKIRRDNGDAAAHYPGISISGNNKNLLFFCFDKATTTSKLSTRGNADGTSNGTSARVAIGNVITNSWLDMRLELDLKNGEYDAYIGGYKLENYKMIGTPTNVSLSNCTLQFGVRVDDIAIYSGTPCELPYTIEGSEAVLAPSEGNFSKVPYGVKDSADVAVTGAVIELEKAYEGMEVRNNNLVVSNNVDAGKKILVAKDSSGNLVGKTTIDVVDAVYYEDFSDVAANATADSAKVEKLDGTASAISMVTTATPVAVSEENKYADAKSTAMTIDLGDETVKGGKFTFSADMCVEGLTHHTEFFLLKDSTGKALVRFNYIKTDTYTRIRSKVKKDGAYYALGSEFDTYYEPGDNWFNFRLEIDLDSQTYDVYCDNELVCNDWSLYKKDNNGNDVINDGTFKTMTYSGEIDNIYVSTGTPYTIVADEARLTIPAAGESSTSITAKYNDGTAVSNLVCTTATAGVTGEGNQVKVSSETAVAPVTVTLSDGFVTGTATFQVDKNYVLVNGAEYTGGSVLAAGSNSIYAVYGASDMKAGNIIYIARYSKDGELISLENFAKSQTTATMIEATLTDSFGENDFAKVFVWDDGTLKPLKAAVEVK